MVAPEVHERAGSSTARPETGTKARVNFVSQLWHELGNICLHTLYRSAFRHPADMEEQLLSSCQIPSMVVFEMGTFLANVCSDEGLLFKETGTSEHTKAVPRHSEFRFIHLDECFFLASHPKSISRIFSNPIKKRKSLKNFAIKYAQNQGCALSLPLIQCKLFRDL